MKEVDIFLAIKTLINIDLKDSSWDFAKGSLTLDNYSDLVASAIVKKLKDMEVLDKDEKKDDNYCGAV